MNLSELHKRLSGKPTYRKAYEAIGDVVLIGGAVRKLREDEGLTQQELVDKLKISQFYLSRLETGSGAVAPEVVTAVVRYFERPLQKLGIDVEPWLGIASSKPSEKEIPSDSPRPILLPEGSQPRRSELRKKPTEGNQRKSEQKHDPAH